MMLTNNVAIVTGGDSGIGHAICLGLAAEGAAVTITYHRNQAAAEQTRQQILQADGKAQIVQADVSNVADLLLGVERAAPVLAALLAIAAAPVITGTVDRVWTGVEHRRQ